MKLDIKHLSIQQIVLDRNDFDNNGWDFTLNDSELAILTLTAGTDDKRHVYRNYLLLGDGRSTIKALYDNQLNCIDIKNTHLETIISDSDSSKYKTTEITAGNASNGGNWTDDAIRLACVDHQHNITSKTIHAAYMKDATFNDNDYSYSKDKSLKRIHILNKLPNVLTDYVDGDIILAIPSTTLEGEVPSNG